VVARISNEEMQVRARVFVERWADEARESAESQTFWNEFFHIFDIDRYEYARFEVKAQKFVGTGAMDVYWPGVIAAEHKSRGKDLEAAFDQLKEYLADPALDPVPLGVVCDFKRFVVEDFNTGDLLELQLEDLPSHLATTFGSLIDGRETLIRAEEEITGQAAALMADLHEALSDNYPRHDLTVLLVRLLFVMFADDTGVWEAALFTKEVEDRSADDLGMFLAELFQVLDTPFAERDQESDFAYINGGLFRETIRIKHFSDEARQVLLECCHSNWSAVSPVIFGSIFQSVMDETVRHELGAHYTPEVNILKVIKPLFLDDLWKEFDQARHSEQALRNLQQQMSELRFMDPACGCGNFLMVSYRELRKLERQILIRIEELRGERDQRVTAENLLSGKKGRSRSSGRRAGQQVTSVADLSLLSPAQFFGIEILEFPARIAETGMYLIDHLANRELSATFGVHLTKFPITEEATIEIGNALRLSWDAVVPADQCDYVFGNPPFAGRGPRTSAQSDDLREVWGARYDVNLDYVTGWYKVTKDYMAGSPVRAAYVSTNSVCQGAQVAPLWGPMLEAGIRIDFAHQTFDWSSELPNAAAVKVVIVGFTDSEVVPGRTRRLFCYPAGGSSQAVESNPTRINPYLVDGRNVLVDTESRPLSPALTPVSFGSMARDGGALFIEEADLQPFLDDPAAEAFVREVIGAREMLHDNSRWCLWMDGAEPRQLRASQRVVDRIDRVREFRLASRAAETREMAETSWLFAQRAQPDTNYLAIPRHVSEEREWFTVGHYPAEVIATDALFTAQDPDRFAFGVLSSKMFLVWLQNIGGRLKSDFRFSKTLVYNTFPMPQVGEEHRAAVVTAADAVVAARQTHPDSSLADLYDPLVMPTDLRHAHADLDTAIDTVFRPRKKTFADDQDRLTVLLERYEEMMEASSGALVFPD
jgi:hypothetical protein